MSSREEVSLDERSAREWALVILGLHIVVVVLLFSWRTTESFEFPKALLLRGTALSLIALFVAAGARVGAGALRLLDPISIGIGAWLISGVISTLCSISPATSVVGAEASFSGLLSVFALAVLYGAARFVARDRAAAWGLIRAVAFATGLSVIYGALQMAELDPFRFDAPIVLPGPSGALGPPRVFSSLGHPNAFAQLLLVGLPAVAAVSWRAGRLGRPGEAGIGAIAMALGAWLLVATGSRAGVVALIGAIALAFAFARATRKVASAPPRGIHKNSTFQLMAAVATATVALAVVLASSDPARTAVRVLGQRLSSVSVRGLADAREDDAREVEPRFAIWRAAKEMFQSSPVTGVGLDAFGLAYGEHRTRESWNAEWGQTPLRAHNELLNLLATRGLIGALAFALLAFGLAQGVARALRRSDADAALALASTAGLAGFALHNLFHFPTIATASCVAAFAGVLAAEARHCSGALADATYDSVARDGGARDATRGSRRRFAIAIAVLSLGSFFLLVEPLRADVRARDAAELLYSDPESALFAIRDATERDPRRPLLWLRRAVAAQAASAATKSANERRARLVEAREAADTGTRLSPLDPYAWTIAGGVISDLGREANDPVLRAAAESAFRRAYELDPRSSFVHIAAATSALAAQDLARAREWAGICAALYGGFAPPRAIQGASLLIEADERGGRGDLDGAAQVRREAIRDLEASLGLNWRGDMTAKAAAEANLSRARVASGATP